MRGVKNTPEGTQKQQRLTLFIAEDDLATLVAWAHDSYRTPHEQASFLLHDILTRKRTGPAATTTNGNANNQGATSKLEPVHG